MHLLINKASQFSPYLQSNKGSRRVNSSMFQFYFPLHGSLLNNMNNVMLTAKNLLSDGEYREILISMSDEQTFLVALWAARSSSARRSAKASSSFRAWFICMEFSV